MQVSAAASSDTLTSPTADSEQLASLGGPPLGADEAADLASLFRLLGDPTRVRILYALLGAGELCVRDLAAAVETSETKVSQAMRLLRTARVVRSRRGGRNVFYRLDDDHVRMVLDLTLEHRGHVEGTA
jgi:ArsR family transcriptional regulator, lead/cadmium/zinc/bismuth-responsive transcriptional repressor